MGDVLTFPTQHTKKADAVPVGPAPPKPSPEAVAEFDTVATHIVDGYGSLDGEDFWNEVEAMKDMFIEWSGG